MDDKKSFLIYKSWSPLIESLDNETAGILVKAIFAYQRGESPVIDDPVLAAIFKMMAAEFDENDAKYQEKCRKRRDAANKRWHSEEHTDVQKHANVSKCMQMNAELEPDPDIEPDTYNSHSSIFIPPTEEEVAAYVRERKYKHVNAKEFVAHYGSKGWKVGAQPMTSWKASVDGWEVRHGREEKARSGTTPRPNRFNDFPQREYDYAALTQALEG